MLHDFGWATASGGEPARARVMSFSYTALQRVERLAPEVPLVQLIDKAQLWPMLERVVGRDWIVGPGIDDAARAPRSWPARSPRSGHDVHVWTVNSDAELALCQELGVKAVITDRPAYLLELLGALGRFSPMAKKSRAGQEVPHQPRPEAAGRSARASPALRVRQALQGLPRRARAGPPAVFVARPFEGLPGECDLVAHARAGPGRDRAADASGLGPHGRPLLAAADGGAGDGPRQRRDLARAAGHARLRRPLARPGRRAAAGARRRRRGRGRRADRPARRRARGCRTSLEGDRLDVTVHDGFDFWLADVDDKDELAGALEQANDAASPTARLTQVEAAYWTSVGTKEHLRWVMPEPEDALLDALARLHVAGKDVIVDGRPPGRHVPRPRPAGPGLGPRRSAPAPRRWRTRPRSSRPTSTPRSPTTRRLTTEERAARSGLANRQVTIR